MIFHQIKKYSINYQVYNYVRNYCYKPIKRPNLNSPSSKAFIEKKLKEFDLSKVLYSKIQASGPIPGKF